MSSNPSAVHSTDAAHVELSRALVSVALLREPDGLVRRLLSEALRESFQAKATRVVSERELFVEATAELDRRGEDESVVTALMGAVAWLRQHDEPAATRPYRKHVDPVRTMVETRFVCRRDSNVVDGVTKSDGYWVHRGSIFGSRSAAELQARRQLRSEGFEVSA